MEKQQQRIPIGVIFSNYEEDLYFSVTRTDGRKVLC